MALLPLLLVLLGLAATTLTADGSGTATAAMPTAEQA
jgi:hypothetical protein